MCQLRTKLWTHFFGAPTSKDSSSLDARLCRVLDRDFFLFLLFQGETLVAIAVARIFLNKESFTLEDVHTAYVERRQRRNSNKPPTTLRERFTQETLAYQWFNGDIPLPPPAVTNLMRIARRRFEALVELRDKPQADWSDDARQLYAIQEFARAENGCRLRLPIDGSKTCE
jgi:hypothetical protein